MTSAAVLGDRVAVEELLSRYTWAIDAQEWDDLPGLFTPDVTIDYRELAGEEALFHGVPDATAFLRKALGWREDALPWHFFSNSIIAIDGDLATSRHYMHNRHLTVLGRYYLQFLRTDQGWRITSLTLKATIRRGPLPEGPLAPPTD